MVFVKGLKIYPNPFKDQVTVISEAEGIFRIYNALGQMIHSVPSEAQKTAVISTGSMAAGIYHYRFTSTLGEVWQGKLVKQ